ncbi:DUF3151 domain-containing protein [Falsarthrobacter nasiphocae]|uniref:DUF3151 domain-containing protein n=1 Tax=Falsarthrobacter nasiphocae TaxID=189863 RepID=A0AAE3YFP8_9MICC|nr:DUF3151 domain-containing protein [Falsarthrobacter nasiphocae]MDR6891872.1 hypothetical protein [Falsarthrobacter nasiphocae]
MSNNLGMPGTGPVETRLPEETDVLSRFEAGDEGADLVRRFPASSLAWAQAAEDAWGEGLEVESYAFARVGYHRGLDSLRRAGWKGAGRIPYSHEPNRGFLRCLVALQRAAAAIGEQDEVTRINDFLNEADPSAKAAILGA